MAGWRSDFGRERAWQESEAWAERESAWREKHPLNERIVPYQETLNNLVNEYPVIIRARAWIGAVLAWLDRPFVGEEECFAEASEELARLRKEVGK